MKKRYARLIPMGVKGGEIGSSTLTITTTLGEHVIPWQDVLFLAIARVEAVRKVTIKQEEPGINNPNINMGVTGMRFDKSANPRNVTMKKSVKQSAVFEAYLVAANQEKPFRFDTVGTNYRQFLGSQAGYSGWVNFSNTFRQIIEKSPNVILSPSAKAFYDQGKRAITTYPSREKAFDDAINLFESKSGPQAHTDTAAPPTAKPAIEDGEEIIRFSLDD